MQSLVLSGLALSWSWKPISLAGAPEMGAPCVPGNPSEGRATVLTVPASLRTEVGKARTRDRAWSCGQDVLPQRMRAVLGAQIALRQREPGAAADLRQSLIELAAVSEEIAGELPAPAARL